MKIWTVLFTFLFLLTSAFTFTQVKTIVFAEEDELTQEEDDAQQLAELEEEIEELEEKIAELQDEQASLQNEIATYDSQIALTQLQIEQSQAQIAETERAIAQLITDIEDLGGRIEKLKKSIDYQEEVLGERLRARYKSRETSPVIVFLGSSTFNSLIQKTEYLQVMEKQDQKLITDMNRTKHAYQLQKGIFEDKKEEEEVLKAQLETEKANLEGYKAEQENLKEEKNILLEQTQNDEAKYQELLDQAIAEANSFRNFSSFAGGGIIGANAFGDGEEGWYFSQRDERWAYNGIGRSGYSVLEVGCLVTSVAMVQKSYGEDVDPEEIADEDRYFFSDTALMLIPWPGPDGRSYVNIGTSLDAIDRELEDGNPVIVGVYHGPYGSHFLVISDGEDGDYTIYDPWYGPDLEFSDYYSTSSIYQAVVFK